MGWMIQGSNPGRGKRLSLFQTDSWAWPASYSMRIGGLSLGELQSVCETYHSPTSKMSRSVLPYPIYAFTACAGTLFLFYSYVITIPSLILVRTNITKYLSFLIHEISTNFLHVYWYYCGLSASLRIYHTANFSSCLPPCAAKTSMHLLC